MRRLDSARRPRTIRPGKTLATFVIALPVLLGMTGLVIDSGTLLASQRMAQNAADAGALAAAMDLYRGQPSATCTTTATTFIQQYNGLSGATPVVNIPPASGPYAGNGQYVEVIVTLPLTMSFIQVLGATASQNVQARAVAGFEPISAGEGAFVLDPNTAPGLAINGSNARLVVNGGVTVNSGGGGTDQFGATVARAAGVSGNASAFTTSNSLLTPAPVVATAIQVHGGIDNIDNFRMYDASFADKYDPANTDRPVFARGPIAPDPLESLATPSTSNGVQNVFPQYLGNGQWTNAASAQNVSVGNADTVTFDPGIYRAINISGGSVTFNPGIYVVGVGFNGGGTTFNINGGTVTGNGVMIYNTGSNYNANGTPDSSDGATLGNAGSANFGKVTINGGTVNLTPISDTSSPFSGILFYQRRWNTQDISVGGNSSSVNLSGTLYAKWANFQLSGGGRYDAQFLVGTMSIGGNATVTINATGKFLGRANQVFLVE